MQWRIYYHDGFRLDGDKTTIIPHERREGVLLVVEQNPEMEWEIHHSANHYVLLKSERWLYLDDAGYHFYTTHKLEEMKCATHGAMVPYEDYRDMMKRANLEMKPPKTAWRQPEQRRVGGR